MNAVPGAELLGGSTGHGKMLHLGLHRVELRARRSPWQEAVSGILGVTINRSFSLRMDEQACVATSKAIKRGLVCRV